jgi:hypothetical protein
LAGGVIVKVAVKVPTVVELARTCRVSTTLIRRKHRRHEANKDNATLFLSSDLTL